MTTTMLLNRALTAFQRDSASSRSSSPSPGASRSPVCSPSSSPRGNPKGMTRPASASGSGTKLKKKESYPSALSFLRPSPPCPSPPPPPLPSPSPRPFGLAQKSKIPTSIPAPIRRPPSPRSPASPRSTPRPSPHTIAIGNPRPSPLPSPTRPAPPPPPRTPEGSDSESQTSTTRRLASRPRSTSIVPSRTQLRHASAARRLSLDGLAKDILPDTNRSPDTSSSSSFSSSSSPRIVVVKKENRDVSSPRPTIRTFDKKGSDASPSEFPGTALEGRRPKRKEIESPPRVQAYERTHPPPPPPAPYLRKTLEAVGVRVIADSASMETLLGSRDFIQASFLTPESVLDKIFHQDQFYHVWVAAMLAREEKPLSKHGIEEVVKFAFTRFLIELGSAMIDCLKPDLPHYTFVDTRKLMHPDGMKLITEQAVSIVEGLEKKGVVRDRVYVSIPATESGLAIAKDLKEKYGIKTNLVFVSGLAQAAACAAAGAASISMPVDKILAYHEFSRGSGHAEMDHHPDWESIKATAGYMKQHNLKTQVVVGGLRSLDELEHCSCSVAIHGVCLFDNQVEPAKWHRTRLGRRAPPSRRPAVSVSTTIAQSPNQDQDQALSSLAPPKPPASDETKPASDSNKHGHGHGHDDDDDDDGGGFGYFSSMTPEVRNETAGILHAGLKSWQDATERVEEVLRREIEDQVRSFLVSVVPPSPGPEPELEPGVEVEMEMETEVWKTMRRERVRPEGISFPSSSSGDDDDDDDDDDGDEVMVESEDDEEEGEGDEGNPVAVDTGTGRFRRAPTSVPPPPSPYWRDLDSFESECGSSSGSSSSDGEEASSLGMGGDVRCF